MYVVVYMKTDRFNLILSDIKNKKQFCRLFGEIRI